LKRFVYAEGASLGAQYQMRRDFWLCDYSPQTGVLQGSPEIPVRQILSWPRALCKYIQETAHGSAGLTWNPDPIAGMSASIDRCAASERSGNNAHERVDAFMGVATIKRMRQF
jgi:hypothetical protein